MLHLLITSFIVQAASVPRVPRFPYFKPPSELSWKIEALRTRYWTLDLSSPRVPWDRKQNAIQSARQEELRRMAWRLIMIAKPNDEHLAASLDWLPQILQNFRILDEHDQLIQTSIIVHYGDLMQSVAKTPHKLSEGFGERVVSSFNAILRTWVRFDQWSVTALALTARMILSPSSEATLAEKSLVLSGLHDFASRQDLSPADRDWIKSLIQPDNLEPVELRELATQIMTQKTGMNCTEDISVKK